jgi:drug/metabolite transporter (DMT)-like permease
VAAVRGVPVIPLRGPVAPRDAPLGGIGFVLVAVSVFPVQDVIIKSLSGAYPVLEIVFVRGLVALWPVAALAWWEGGPAALVTRRPGLHLARGLLAFLSYTTYYMAIATLSLAELVALYFAAPFFLVALSSLVLREPVGTRRWAAVAVGFLGVLVVLRPGTAVFDPAALLALLSALFYAGSQTITRRLGRTDSGATMALTAIVLALLLAALSAVVTPGSRSDALHPTIAFLVRRWLAPRGRDLGLMGLCGVISGLGSYCLAQAYRLAPARVVAPFEYVMIAWAVLWGYLVWDDVPGPFTILGVALTVGAGLQVLRDEAAAERRRRREAG